MVKSMTGFGRREADIPVLGKFVLELRSSNHKFLEIVLHLPPGFLALEDRIKKEIEVDLKRGRVTGVLTVSGGSAGRVFVNRNLLKSYIQELKEAGREFGLGADLRLETLIHLPGVLSLAEGGVSAEAVWPRLKTLTRLALEDLLKTRVREGGALRIFLKKRAEGLKLDLEAIEARFKKVVKAKAAQFSSDEERASFLKDADISEELERLNFHVRNFLQKLSRNSPIGKELDFIAQEMQREANTMGAKSCDARISGMTVKIKSEIEKMREQAQNVE